MISSTRSLDDLTLLRLSLFLIIIILNLILLNPGKSVTRRRDD